MRNIPINDMTADDLVALLDNATSQLAELAETDRAKQHLKDLRTYLGFECGGYVGQPNVCELVEDGEFRSPFEEDDN